MAVALFDLDGTLTEGASCERRFVLHLAARGLLGGRQMAAAAGFALRHWPVYGRHVLKKNRTSGPDSCIFTKFFQCLVENR